MKSNYIKAKFDKAQHNNKYRLWGDIDETVYYIISECRKLAQKNYKNSHD